MCEHCRKLQNMKLSWAHSLKMTDGEDNVTHLWAQQAWDRETQVPGSKVWHWENTRIEFCNIKSLQCSKPWTSLELIITRMLPFLWRRWWNATSTFVHRCPPSQITCWSWYFRGPLQLSSYCNPTWSVSVHPPFPWHWRVLWRNTGDSAILCSGGILCSKRRLRSKRSKRRRYLWDEGACSVIFFSAPIPRSKRKRRDLRGCCSSVIFSIAAILPSKRRRQGLRDERCCVVCCGRAILLLRSKRKRQPHLLMRDEGGSSLLFFFFFFVFFSLWILLLCSNKGRGDLRDDDWWFLLLLLQLSLLILSSISHDDIFVCILRFSTKA